MKKTYTGKITTLVVNSLTAILLIFLISSAIFIAKQNPDVEMSYLQFVSANFTRTFVICGFGNYMATLLLLGIIIFFTVRKKKAKNYLYEMISFGIAGFVAGHALRYYDYINTTLYSYTNSLDNLIRFISYVLFLVNYLLYIFSIYRLFSKEEAKEGVKVKVVEKKPVLVTASMSKEEKKIAKQQAREAYEKEKEAARLAHEKEKEAARKEHEKLIAKREEEKRLAQIEAEKERKAKEAAKAKLLAKRLEQKRLEEAAKKEARKQAIIKYEQAKIEKARAKEVKYLRTAQQLAELYKQKKSAKALKKARKQQAKLDKIISRCKAYDLKASEKAYFAALREKEKQVALALERRKAAKLKAERLEKEKRRKEALKAQAKWREERKSPEYRIRMKYERRRRRYIRHYMMTHRK